MSILSLRIDDFLLKKLDEVAKKTGKTRSEVIKDILRRELAKEDILSTAIEQMRKGQKPGHLSLKEVEKWLKQTRPYFATWQEAMEKTRYRGKIPYEN